MSKILLLGGTGAMGVYLSMLLVKKGHEVIVTSRLARQSTNGISFMQGNAKDDDFLRECLSLRPDAIVDFMVYSTSEFSQRVELLTSSTKHYLFLSSYRVFGESSPIDEKSPRLLDWSTDVDYLKTDEYGLTKARQEDVLKTVSASWTIIRPGVTYSRNRFQFGCLETNVVCWRALHGLPLVMPKEMLGKNAALSWGKDVAEMIARLVLNPKAYREIFIVASSERHTWNDVFSIYERAIGAKLVTCSIDEYIKIVGNKAPVLYDRMFNRVINNEKILKVTGLRQDDLSPLSESLSKELAEFVKNPIYSSMNWRAMAIIDRLTGTHALSVAQGLSWRERLDYYASYYPLIGRLRILIGAFKRRLTGRMR